jgi:excisionase family DNA binding protein
MRRSAKGEVTSTTMTVPEMAAFLKVHTSTIMRLCKRGEIGFKVGGSWRFHRVQVDKWCSDAQAKVVLESRRGTKRTLILST